MVEGNGDIINDSRDDDTDSSELQKKEEEKEVNVEDWFLYVPTEPIYLDGVKRLLQSYLGDKEWDLNGFVDLIVGQTTVGQVVKVELDEGDRVFSVASALSFDTYKDHRCIMELKDFLLESCLDKNVNVLSDLTTMLLGDQAQGVGLLLSWHSVNFFPQLSPRLSDHLFDQILEATKNKELTEELRESFRFKHYLLVTQIKMIQQNHSGSSLDVTWNIQNQNHSGSSEIEYVTYIKPQDEIFFQLSSWSFNFPLKRQEVTPKELQPKTFKQMGLVMAIEASKISAFRQKFESFSRGAESYHMIRD